MAKQVGPLFFTGTIDGVVFYKLNGQYYMRSKGDYKSGKQMRKDPAFKRTMHNADRFGVASKLVKYLYYRHVPKAVRKHGLFGKLTGMANRLLQEGKCKEEITEALIAYCQSLATAPKATKATSTVPTSTALLPLQDTCAPSAKEMNPAKPARCVKQARYLSRWKVKYNGQLHVPKHALHVKLPIVVPLTCTAQVDPGLS